MWGGVADAIDMRGKVAVTYCAGGGGEIERKSGVEGKIVMQCVDNGGRR